MIQVECTRCGGDCSTAYGTYMGYPYHILCLPTKKAEKDDPDELYPSDVEV